MGRAARGPARRIDHGHLALRRPERRTVDFTQTLSPETIAPAQARDFLRPEFLNRLDEVLTDNALQPDQLREIVEVQLTRPTKHLHEQDIAPELTGAAKGALAKGSYDSKCGARPLKRVLQHVLADAILSGRLEVGARKFELTSEMNEPEVVRSHARSRTRPSLAIAPDHFEARWKRG